jgi:hypothetical protein
MQDGSGDLLGWVHGGGSILHLLLEIGLIVVAATVVRRAHAGAAWLIACSGVLGVLVLCGSTAGHALIARVGSSSEHYVSQLAVLSAISTVVSSIGFALLIAGIVRLASALHGTARRDPRDPELGART